MSDYESDDSDLRKAIALSLQDVNSSHVVDVSDDENKLEAAQSKPGSARPLGGIGGAGHLSPTQDNWAKPIINNHESLSAAPTNFSGLPPFDTSRSYEGSNGNGSKKETGIHQTESKQPGVLRESASKSDMPKSMPDQVRNASQYPPGLPSILGVNRKKMEEERLARVKKRKAELISPPLVNRRAREVQHQTVYKDGDHRAGKKAMLTESSSFTLRQNLSELAVSTLTKPPVAPGNEVSSLPAKPYEFSYGQQKAMLAPGIQFPCGIVKKTWAYGYPRQDDIKIEEVFQKNDLELAVLSSFQWDDEWVLSKLNLRKTKVICVMQAEREEQKAEIRANAPPNIRFCFPSMAGQINCMHSKLQLLSHPTHLRIAVPSANLVPYDWGEGGGFMENAVFIIDLPRVSNGSKISAGTTTSFFRELRYFLESMGMENSVLDSLSNFDFTRTARLAFVHSIGGSHSGIDLKRTGFYGLGSSIRELGLVSEAPLCVDYVSASIGSLNEDFLKSIYLAAKGDDNPLKGRPSSGQSKYNMENADRRISKGIEKHFRIYFPSHETVVRSKGGIGGGGTICFQSKWYNAHSFPRSLMRDCHSERPGMLMHNKMLFARLTTPIRAPGDDSNNVQHVAWAYVGSANLSESAWGRLVTDKATKMPRLNCRNWECGVVVPVTVPVASVPENSGSGIVGLTNQEGGAAAGFPEMNVFQGVVPVPMHFPGEEYGTKKPWFYHEHS